MTETQLAAIIAYFAAAYPQFDPSDDTVDVWWNEVKDIDGGVAYQAMRNVVQTSEFAPTIARFRAECRIVAHQESMRSTRPELPRGVAAFPKELVDDLRAMLREKSAQIDGRMAIRRRGVSGTNQGGEA